MLKKFTLLFLGVGISFLSFSQISYGIKGGVTQSTMTGIEGKLKGGLQLGVTLDALLAKNLSFRPSLQYTQKGFKSIEGDRNSYYYSYVLSASYIELPLDLVYNLRINKAAGIFAGAGPVLSYGLSGKGKELIISKPNDRFVTYEREDPKPFNDFMLKRFDLGADFLIGIKYNRASLGLNYNHGLINNYNHGNEIRKNRSFGLSLSYFINK